MTCAPPLRMLNTGAALPSRSQSVQLGCEAASRVGVVARCGRCRQDMHN